MVSCRSCRGIPPVEIFLPRPSWQGRRLGGGDLIVFRSFLAERFLGAGPGQPGDGPSWFFPGSMQGFRAPHEGGRSLTYFPLFAVGSRRLGRGRAPGFAPPPRDDSGPTARGAI